MLEKKVLIVTEDTVEDSRGWGDIQKRLSRVAEIPVSVLAQNMKNFLHIVNDLFQQSEQQIDKQSELKLCEIELQVEISGKGEVRLFAGGEASGKGVITLKFKRG